MKVFCPNAKEICENGHVRFYENGVLCRCWQEGIGCLNTVLELRELQGNIDIDALRLLCAVGDGLPAPVRVPNMKKLKYIEGKEK
jgi:hypothetical protein